MGTHTYPTRNPTDRDVWESHFPRETHTPTHAYFESNFTLSTGLRNEDDPHVEPTNGFLLEFDRKKVRMGTKDATKISKAAAYVQIVDFFNAGHSTNIEILAETYGKSTLTIERWLRDIDREILKLGKRGPNIRKWEP